jgi:hypothetical protein
VDEECDIEKEYCNDNGIFGTFTKPRDDIMLCKVDTEKTKIADFHTWSDVLAGANPDHAWRPFFWLGESSVRRPDDELRLRLTFARPERAEPVCSESNDRWGWKEEVTLKLGTLPLADLWAMVLA